MDAATYSPELAFELVRPYLKVAAIDVLRRAAMIERELAEGIEGVPPHDYETLLNRIGARVALGEGYGWNLYELDTAWSSARIEDEILDELLDAIVYRALSHRLRVLAIGALPIEAWVRDMRERP